MFLMYGAYAITFWLIFAIFAAFQLPTHPNASAGSIFHFVIGPLVAVCCSAELLIHVKTEDKRALAKAFADQRLSWRTSLGVGVACALTATTLAVGVYFLIGRLWNTLTAVG